MTETKKPYRNGDRLKEKDPKQPETRVSFKTNEALNIIVEGLEQINPDWNELLDTLTDAQKIKIQGKANGHLLGRLAEIHVARVLETLAVDNPLIKLWPIPHDHETKSFRLEHSGVNYVAYKKGGTTACVEYDMLTEVNNLPVIWEVKIGYSLSQAISAQRIKNIAKPLTQYYGHANFGYVVVAPTGPDQLTIDQEKFITKGGLIARIPTTKTQFEYNIKSANGNGHSL